jgi:hypothetical protein
MKYCLFAAFCMCAIAFRATAADDQGVRTKVNNEGVTLSLALPEKMYAGAEISIVISIKNEGKRDVSFYEGSKYGDYHFALVDSKGLSAPLTRFGKEIFENGEGGKRIRRTLQSGKEIQETLNIARIFDLTLAGDYALTFSRTINESVPGEFNLSIKKFAFKVLEPTK